MNTAQSRKIHVGNRVTECFGKMGRYYPGGGEEDSINDNEFTWIRLMEKEKTRDGQLSQSPSLTVCSQGSIFSEGLKAGNEALHCAAFHQSPGTKCMLLRWQPGGILSFFVFIGS